MNSDLALVIHFEIPSDKEDAHEVSSTSAASILEVAIGSLTC